MKKIVSILLLLALALSLTACNSTENPDSPDNGGEVGGDWHAWGLYSFEPVNNFTIAVDQVNNESGQHIGYDIYMDGTELGAKLGEIRCTDGGYTPDDMDQQDYIFIEDINEDGLEDIGAELKNDDVMWYLQGWDEADADLPLFQYAYTTDSDGQVK